MRAGRVNAAQEGKHELVYATIVEGKVRTIFDQTNQGDFMPMVYGLADPFSYEFHGDHALGGRRTSREAMIAWWERALRLLRGAQFDVHDVLVSGVHGAPGLRCDRRSVGRCPTVSATTTRS